MAIYVGRWDCNTCGYKGILGPETQCPNCGAARPKGVVFYQAAEKDIVQNPEILKKAKAGADWRCSYCGGHNKAWQKQCTTCGNQKSIQGGDNDLEVIDYTLANTPTSGETKKERVIHPEQQSTPPKRRKWKRWVFGGLGLFFVLILLLGYTRESTVQVASFEWERVISVEQNVEVIEEDWTLPQGGRLLSEFSAIHHYDKILEGYETRTRTVQEAVGTEEYVCGTRSLGNGYMEDKYCTRTIYESREETYEEPVYRKEAVYRTKYRYAIFRWQSASPISTSGDNQVPKWGNVQRIEENPKLRISKKEGTYTVIVQDKNEKIHKEQIPFEKWRTLEKGQTLQAKEGIMGGYRGLDDGVLKN